MRDSIVTRTETKEIIRDSIIHIPADSSFLEALIKCDSAGNATLSQLLDYKAGYRLRLPQIKIIDNILTVSASVDSLSVYLRWKEIHSTSTIQETKTLQPLTVNYLTGWQWTQVYLGRLLLAVLVTFVGYYLIKSKFF